MSLKQKIWLALLILIGVYIGKNIYYYKFAFPLGSRDGKGNLYPISIYPKIKSYKFQDKCLEYKQISNNIEFSAKFGDPYFSQLVIYKSEGSLENKCSQSIKIRSLTFQSKLSSEAKYSGPIKFPEDDYKSAMSTNRYIIFDDSQSSSYIDGYSSINIKLFDERMYRLDNYKKVSKLASGENIPTKDDYVIYRIYKGDVWQYQVDLYPKGNIDWRDLADQGLLKISLSMKSPHGTTNYWLEDNNCIRYGKERDPNTYRRIEKSCTSPKWQIKTKKFGLIENEYDLIDSFDLNKLYKGPYKFVKLNPSELE